jgi:hypothetical protein
VLACLFNADFRSDPTFLNAPQLARERRPGAPAVAAGLRGCGHGHSTRTQRLASQGTA